MKFLSRNPVRLYGRNYSAYAHLVDLLPPTFLRNPLCLQKFFVPSSSVAFSDLTADERSIWLGLAIGIDEDRIVRCWQETGSNLHGAVIILALGLPETPLKRNLDVDKPGTPNEVWTSFSK